MKGDVLILSLAVLLALFPYTESCSCMPSHPQTHFCRSDFVILARVKQERVLDGLKVYKVRIRKEYKISEKVSVGLKAGRLLTSAHEAMCGVNLEIGKLYVISGSIRSLRAYVNLCNMVVPWKDLTRRQRKGLKGIYKHTCDCQIDYCRYRKCKKTNDSCIMSHPCYAKDGICQKQKSGKCRWNRNTALANCLKSNEPTISRWSG